eukprot:2665092-Amphidinium_carterae.1
MHGIGNLWMSFLLCVYLCGIRPNPAERRISTKFGVEFGGLRGLDFGAVSRQCEKRDKTTGTIPVISNPSPQALQASANHINYERGRLGQSPGVQGLHGGQ